MSGRNKKRGPGVFGVIRMLILLIAVGVFVYSGWQLYSIFSVYKKSSDEYSSLADEFTHDNSEASGFTDPAAGESTASGNSADDPASPDFFNPLTDVNNGMLIEDADPPITVDWDQLRAINPEIVGWIYVEGLPTINYPVCRGSDNEYYLHRTFRGEYLFAGSIFVDYHNEGDFSNPNTIVYGHNMKDGSMFNSLKKLNEQAAYDADPYFWILTPNGNYRYHIYCVMTTAVDSDAYVLYDYNTQEFLHWEEKMQSLSEVKNSVPLSEYDHSVVLSTCVSDDSYRRVVIGKCVSRTQPAVITPTPEPLRTAEPEYDLDDIEIDPNVEYYD